MRKSKIIKINDKEITIKELRVRDIYELTAGDDKQSLKNRLEDALARCSDIQNEELMDMTPSELESFWGAFKEVNSSFLSLAEAAGLGSVVEIIKEAVQKELKSNLQQQFAGLSQQDTAQ